MHVLSHVHFLFFRECFRNPHIKFQLFATISRTPARRASECFEVKRERVAYLLVQTNTLSLPFSFFVVSFSTEQSRYFRSAPSNACARKSLHILQIVIFHCSMQYIELYHVVFNLRYIFARRSGIAVVRRFLKMRPKSLKSVWKTRHLFHPLTGEMCATFTNPR